MIAVRWRRPIAALVGLMVIYYTIPSGFTTNGRFFVGLATTIAALVLLAWAITSQVRKQMFGGTEVAVQSLVLLVEMVVVVFAYGFYLLEQARPGEIAGLDTRTDSLYFTLTTMTTVGYGDIHAAGQVARVVVLVQLFFNVVFVGALVSILTATLRGRVEQRVRRKSGGDDGQAPPSPP
ncbi:ion channel [Kribbella amoyensis]|uniref:Ion channel n=1 Tax=Kribbella amoyensis TaxID=996641 RepID=A0A561BMP2_9ACTN|nr:potassium channel family protein [Kribbella amoyensis]TWD80052.1 ion channel [Kribbella amoyensis]